MKWVRKTTCHLCDGVVSYDSATSIIKCDCGSIIEHIVVDRKRWIPILEKL